MKNRNKSSIIFITLIVVVLLLIGGSTTILASKRKVTAIGDSVMLGAVPNIKKAVPGCTVDAKVSRQVVKGTEIAKQLNKKGKLGNIVVIALGTNGPFKQSAGQKLINYLGKKRTIYWMTTYGKHLKWMKSVNKVIYALAKKNKNVHVIDWAGKAASHSEWLYKDGVHLQPKGRAAYAKMIAQKIK